MPARDLFIRKQQRHQPKRRRLERPAVKDDCRDKVNSPSQREAVSDRKVKVTFQGAGDQAVEIECPEVKPEQTQCHPVHPTPGNSTASGPLQDMYILDAGLEAGLDLPYTCRGGICGYAPCSLSIRLPAACNCTSGYGCVQGMRGQGGARQSGSQRCALVLWPTFACQVLV